VALGYSKLGPSAFMKNSGEAQGCSSPQINSAASLASDSRRLGGSPRNRRAR
jgi:hypothetical protein